MTDKKGTCWKCGHQLAEVYPAINGTPGFYVCDTPGCSENYAENCAREARLENMDCEHCTYWIQDKTDAIGMGYCNNPQSLRGLTAPDEWCTDFDERPKRRDRLDKIAELMERNAAEIAFSGLGLFDIFKPTKGERVYVGSVLLDLDNPPFFIGEGIYFKYAPGFVLFPRGVVHILVDGSHTRRGRDCEPVACEEVLRSDAGNPELL